MTDANESPTTEKSQEMTSEKETAADTNNTKIKKEEDKDDDDDEEVIANETNEPSEDKKETTTTTTSSAKKETAAKPKKKKSKFPNWPMKDIKEPHEHDVLYGRGGGTNHHPGNKRYRKMVEERKLDYVNSKRLDKPLVALDIIRQWRGQDPPGRFLKCDEKTGLYQDVGDKKAREKTSQALREKAPLIRKQQEEEEMEERGEDEIKSKKSTRFAAGTHLEREGSIRKPGLVRDHSLGREYLQPGADVALDGFSWEEPFDLDAREGGRNYSRNHSGNFYPHGRVSSQGSLGVAGPPGPHYTPTTSMSTGYPSSDYRTSSPGAPPGRFESWGSVPPPPMPYGTYNPHNRSGSWSEPPPPAPPNRQHSLSCNPLRNASVTGPAMMDFDSAGPRDGYWGPEAPLPHYPSFPPPHQYNRRTASGREIPYPQEAPPRQGSPYNIDPSIAQTWSGEGPSGPPPPDWPEPESLSPKGAAYGKRSSPPPRRRESPMETGAKSKGGNILEEDPLERPATVKRMTSNQYETVETKQNLVGSSVKRAALNRDNSLASNRLKAAYLTDKMDAKEIFESELTNVKDSLEQTTLTEGGEVSLSEARPKALSSSERESTIDKIAMDLMVKPEPLNLTSRSSTIEALSLDFDDPIIGDDFQRTGTEDSLIGDSEILPKPKIGNRMSTMEFLDNLSQPSPQDEEPIQPAKLKKEVSVSEWLEGV